jgi:hypothetical protein
MEKEDEGFSTATTAVENDLLLFSHPDLNPAYTLVFGVIATSQQMEAKQPAKYVFSRRPAYRGGRFKVPWFESPEDSVGPPGGTVVSLTDWPEMWEHPERLKTAFNLAGLIAHFEQREMKNWNAFVDSFRFFLRLQESPMERFNVLAAEWKEGVRLLSDTNEICSHSAYQGIIGMGVLGLPFIFAELEREPDQWFWALKAITGHDPVGEDERGNLVLMTKAWLRWATDCKETLGAEWARVFLRAIA